jgi:Ca2+-binding RTX toxin-like protein
VAESVTIGGASKAVSVYGPNASVYAGGGNDTVFNHGTDGFVRIGGGSDHVNMYQGGTVTESGIHGHDTIYWGASTSGTATLDVEVHGKATVYGSHAGHKFEIASIAGGNVDLAYSHGVLEETAVSGKLTLIGGAAKTEFIGGSGGHTVMLGGTGSDTFVGGSGHDTMTGGTGHSLFEFLSSYAGGNHVITNFVAGDKLYLEGHSLSFLESQHEISTKDGNTYIKLDDGKTTIELKGFTGLHSSDITNHK